MGETRVGRLRGTASNGSVLNLELSVVHQVQYPSQPQIDMAINKTGQGSTVRINVWSFFSDEALELARMLEEAATTAESKSPREIGRLTEPGSDKSRSPWLTVAVLAAPYLKTAALRVHLLFDDPLVRENPAEGDVWLTNSASRTLARLATGAVAILQEKKNVWSGGLPGPLGVGTACRATTFHGTSC